MKVKSFASIVSISAMAMLGFATPAFAVDEDQPPAVTGSLTIHKYESPESSPDLPNNGTAIDASDLVGLTAMAGVTFTIAPITGLDLETAAGWATLNGYVADPGTIPAGNLGAVVDTQTTNASGVAFFDEAALGAYLVTEKAPYRSDVVIPAAPFVISVPLPTGLAGDNAWLYDVHVYPKNMVSSVSKTIDATSAYSLGDRVEWTITSVIPGAYGSEVISSFALQDNLDPRLRYVSGSATGLKQDATAPIGEITQPDVALVEDTDFTVTAITPVGSEGLGGQQLSFSLLPAHISTLSDFAGGYFSITFETEVIGVGSGTISNTPFANINGNTFSGTPVNTTWGVVDLFKFEEVADEESSEPGATTKLGLAGAVFEVYASETGGTALEFIVLPTSDTAETTVTQFTTDADGHVTIPGLRVGQDYWVEEVTAPTGYQRLVDRVKITGLSASNGIETPLVLEVKNIPVPDWQLPLTGGSGLLVPLMGIALLAVSAGTASVMSRRKSSAQ